MDRDLVKILGYGVDSFTFDEAVEYAYSHHGQIVTINPEMISEARKNKDFSEIVEHADLVVPDGIGVEIGLKILGHKVRRIPGIELGRALIVKFSDENKTVAFVGAKPEVVESAVKMLRTDIQNLNVVYFHDGYFKDANIIMDSLYQAKPDLVLVALGSPKQEFLLLK